MLVLLITNMYYVLYTALESLHVNRYCEAKKQPIRILILIRFLSTKPFYLRKEHNIKSQYYIFFVLVQIEKWKNPLIKYDLFKFFYFSLCPE